MYPLADPISMSGDGEGRYMDGTHNQKVLDDVRGRIAAGVDDEDLRDRALGFVDTLEGLLVRESVDSDLPRIPVDLGHREVYLEMILPHLRMGLVIDADRSEDGWFLATDDSLGGEDRVGGMDSLADAVRLLGELTCGDPDAHPTTRGGDHGERLRRGGVLHRDVRGFG